MIAHINESGKEQTIKEHLLGTADLAKQYADEFGCGKIGYLCGLMHDIGKYSEEFQRRIRDPEHVKKVDHSTAGAKELSSQSSDYLPLAMAVAGHHSGLLNGGNARIAGEGTFFGRLHKEIPTYEKWKEEIFPEKVELPEFCLAGTNPGFTMSIFIRMIYSCLVDADYLDTEKFMSSGSVVRGSDVSCAELLERFRDYISAWVNRTDFDNERQKQICEKRTKILLDCMEKGRRFERGIYTLTVPTGGGKTTASLGFALEQLQRHKMQRIIYVIPYTSIIDQNAAVFRDILGEDYVLEHHSGLLYDLEEESPESSYGKALATENWDKPVIVTTAVQFFESLYASKSSKCRKLHNIANSVIIFDEAQTIPTAYLEPCVAVMAELSAHYRSTVVLCTATQPALDSIFARYLQDSKIREICDEVRDTFAWFRRTAISYAGTLSLEELCGALAQKKQVLCIVNRRRTAQEMYERLKEEGTYCLTTLLYPAARRRKIADIKERLEAGLPCRVIATSLIEAGVDVDFPEVYREEAGLDSVIQAAGRCNREGKHPAEESVVSVFGLDGSKASYLAQNIAAFQWMREKFEDVGDLNAISGYFRFYRELLGQENLDTKGIMDMFLRGWNGNIFPFREAAQQFHLIENETTAVYIPLEEGAELVEQLVRGAYSRNTFRQLGQFSVNVYPNHLKALLESGCVKQLEGEVYVLHDLTQYRDDIGLRMDTETGNGIFY